MKDALIATISTFHTKKIIISDPVKFLHYGSIPETMYRSVTQHSKVMADYSKLHSTEPRVLTPEQQAALDALDKPSGRGKRINVKKETTEAKTSKPSKSKKRKTRTESSSKPKKIKRMARKPKGPSPLPSDNEDDEEDKSPRGNTPPRSSSLIPEVKIPTPPQSPKLSPPKPDEPTPTPTPKLLVLVASTSITETSLPPPPVSSVSISTTPFTTPIITPITITTTIPDETTSVNVSDTGALTVSKTPVLTLPPSPTKSTDSGATLGRDNDEYDSTYFSPYRLQSDEDIEAPINRQHLDSIHEKLDKLLADTKAYGGVVLKAFVETAIEQYTKAMDKSTDAVNESTSLCKKATTDIAEVVRTTHIFLDSLKGHADTNVAKVRASVDSLSQTLQEEHTKFEDVCSSLKANNATLISSVSSKLDSMHAEIAKESALKEEIAKQASTIVVQQVQLTQAEKEISLLKTERTVFRSCANDVKDMLTNILGAHDPILTLSIRNHLTTKLLPALTILHEMKGVSEPFVAPKQGGEESQKADITKELKVNVASGSGPKEKIKQIGLDSNSDTDETIAEALQRKKRDKELDENLKISKEAEETERRNKET
ncbi:uncharacterized protein LOC111882635 [Lactuca sativa]|uniref:uncharacterized protein LOC111882635 n=1 Tax=Lactuca sativa TaxID=4236 RepID=UPI000CD94FD2|nr:uncharacterized protein LOC111882635 [Lactuca sativa]